jgi:hypothetical protein
MGKIERRNALLSGNSTSTGAFLSSRNSSDSLGFIERAEQHPHIFGRDGFKIVNRKDCKEFNTSGKTRKLRAIGVIYGCIGYPLICHRLQRIAAAAAGA